MKGLIKFDDFITESLDQAEERFNVIDRSFMLLMEDFKKIAMHIENVENGDL
jgi:hypothetical protein